MAYAVLDKKLLSVTSSLNDGYIHLKVKATIKIAILLILC